MNDNSYQPHTVELTDEEKDLLETIYRTRLKTFLSAFTAMVFAGIYGVIRSTGKRYPGRSRETRTYHPTDYEIMGHVLSRGELRMLMAIFIFSIIFYFAIRIFFKKVYPYRKDAKSGAKEVVYKTVTDKKYFSTTNQYFLSFDDPNYMHHEVDAAMYLYVEEGSSVALFKGLHSGYVFHKDGKFTIM